MCDKKKKNKKNSVIYVCLNCIWCLKCTNGTQEAAKLQNTNAGPQGYHHSLLLGLKHCLLLPAEVLNVLQALGLLRKERQKWRERQTARARLLARVKGGRRRKQCERRLKRGKRAGVRARLKANARQPALPSILLSNIRSLETKLDYIRLCILLLRNGAGLSAGWRVCWEHVARSGRNGLYALAVALLR